MALARSMTNLMHDRAQASKPMRAGTSRVAPPQQAKPAAVTTARPQPSQRRAPRGGMAKITPPGQPGTGTFGFADKKGVRGGFQTPPASVEGDRIARQVSGTGGPVPGRRGGGIPRAFGSRQYLR